MPDARQAQHIAYACKALAKCDMKPKQVMSAMINVCDPRSWQIPFGDCPVLMQMLDDVMLMRPAVLQHPLCQPFAAALAAAGTATRRAISLCLGHLDDQALTSAGTALRAAGCLTGPTANDSVLVFQHSPLDPPSTLTCAVTAASQHLLFPVAFTFLPGLMKPGEAAPTLASIAADLCPNTSRPASATSNALSDPTDTPDSSDTSDTSDTPDTSDTSDDASDDFGPLGGPGPARPLSPGDGGPSPLPPSDLVTLP